MSAKTRWARQVAMQFRITVSKTEHTANEKHPCAGWLRRKHTRFLNESRRGTRGPWIAGGASCSLALFVPTAHLRETWLPRQVAASHSPGAAHFRSHCTSSASKGTIHSTSGQHAKGLKWNSANGAQHQTGDSRRTTAGRQTEIKPHHKGVYGQLKERGWDQNLHFVHA